MLIDLHVHTIAGSWDSLLRPDDLIVKAREIGLDAITITEHGKCNMGALEQLRKEHGFPVLGGMEVSTDIGDILVFGLGNFDVGYMEATKLRQLVTAQGGIMIAAHPFRRDFSPVGYGSFNPLKSISLEEACKRPLLKLVDALEAANGGSTKEEVLFSLQVMEKLGMCGTGGSDCHTISTVGLCATEFTVQITSETDIVEAIKKGACRPIDRRRH